MSNQLYVQNPHPPKEIVDKIKNEDACLKNTLINKKLNDCPSCFYDFDGNNCNDGSNNCLKSGMSCEGWDGESHRCECGNRRVDWEFNDDKT